MNTRSLLLLVATMASSCLHREANSPDASVALDAGALRDAGVDAHFDAGLAAASQVASTDPRCTKLGDFIWEIGDAAGPLGGGTIGNTYTRESRMQIASATKWLFGAYVVERFKNAPESIDVNAMTMRSGYSGLNYVTCTSLGSPTVTRCFTALNNDRFSPSEVGAFHYNGGHFQKYAIDLGLGEQTNAGLATVFKQMLGADLDVEFDTPQLAAGAVMSVQGYSVFLRKILSNSLAIHDALGSQGTCTLPSVCSTAIESPAPLAWHYRLGHWVEDEPGGDGAFSSAGAYGFYPWVDASKTYYGVIARHVIGAQAYAESAECGRVVRAAFLAQLSR